MPQDSLATIGTPISRLPYGLLGLFGIKSQGQLPLYLRSDYQPVLDQIGLLHVNHQSPFGVGGPFAIAQAPGVFNSPDPLLTVPQNEAWYFPAFACSLQIIQSVASTYSAAIAARILGTAGVVRLLSLATTFTTTAAVPQFHVSNATDFWLGPGDELGYIAASDFAAVGATGRMRLHPVKMPL